MTREQFARNLVEALETYHQSVSDQDIEKFLDLNYDEDGDWDWSYEDFTQFALEVSRNFGDFWLVVECADLHTPKEYEDEEDY